MSVLLDKDTRVVVSGVTGSEGTFHTRRNISYGTNVVAGVTPGKGGQRAVDDKVPVFDTVAEAVQKAGANASLIFVPARFAADSIVEAVDAGCSLVVCITEGIPTRDMAEVYPYVRAKGVALIGPNCPGLISPGKANMGIIPGEITGPGPIGLISRSGTLTYQVMYEMFSAGVGQSTCVGIGGDPIVGSNFIDMLARFQADPETEAIVLIGEIGGDEEEKAAAYIAEKVTKPVTAYIAGFTAPEGKRMGHAGAIVSGSKGTAKAKKETFESFGIRVGTNPTETAELAVKSLS
ncbi:MAG: succinate--CoA ligase subunit alpha [Actinobacteria bacterium]|nr:MAG: succinate--CoA ligase subunit alpha [Actinomycetota bacterium]